MIVDGQEVDRGMIVQFRTMNPKDPNVRQGYVVALANYDIAKTYMDVVKYHEEVLENGAYSDETDVTALNFMILKTEDSS